MADSIENAGGGQVVLSLCEAIRGARDWLGEIDGAIGDGDHGANMAKGFGLAASRISPDDTLSDALETLGDTLVDDIGGSMGPLYGTLFTTFSDAFDGKDEIGAAEVDAALSEAAEAVMGLAGAKPGDKTLVDVLDPASKAFSEARASGKGFAECLDAMSAASEAGWKSTEGMVARKGRAARLGERSKGHLDAGATSCNIVLQTLTHEMKIRIK